MSYLPFVWLEPTSLLAELRKPIKQVSVEFDVPSSGPRFLALWGIEAGLRFYTEMHDVAERREVGVLHIERAFSHSAQEITVDLPEEFQSEIAVFKLVIQESGTTAESGLILGAGQSQIVVVAGAFPYSLAVRGAFSLPHIFDPEYAIERYERVPFVDRT